MVPKPLFWIASSKKDIKGLPKVLQNKFGYALHMAQMGEKHDSAKPLKGFSGAGVLEVVENRDGDTYRAVYTVRFAQVVYVLHVFQKKSKSGIATPQQDVNIVRSRLKLAEEDYAQWQRQQKKP